MELNKIDGKLLAYLCHHAREPSTKIARAVGMTREQVEYRINKYLSTGVIKTFTTLFNYSAFGYKQYVVFLLKFSKPEHAKKFFNKALDRNTIGKGFMLSGSDIWIESLFRSKEESRRYLNKMLDEQKEKIADYRVLYPHIGKIYTLKFLGVEEKGTGIYFNPEVKEVKLDDKELKIVKMLEKDGREKIVDIASSLKISPELVLYKIKKLYEKKVISTSAAIFDVEKLGYFLSSVIVNIQNLSRENEEKIKKFADETTQIRSYMMMDSKPNVFMQIFHKEHGDLISVLRELKDLFEKDIIEIEVLHSDPDKIKIDALPFL